MKKVMLGFFFILLVFDSKSSILCSDNGICLGDRVVPSFFREGHAKVISLDLSLNTANVQKNNGRIYSRIPLSGLYLTKGCFLGGCVGEDTVINSSDYETDQIVGYNKTLSLYLVQRGPFKYFQLPRVKLALSKGCLQGICFGDIVVAKDHSLVFGFVKGISPDEKYIVVKGKFRKKFLRFSPEELIFKEAQHNYSDYERFHYVFE